MTATLRWCIPVITFCALFVMVPSFSQSLTPTATIEYTKAGLEAGLELLREGEAEGAADAVRFSSEIFASGLQGVRERDRGLTDEIHISLLDASSAGTGLDPDAVGDVMTKLERLEADDPTPRLTAAWLLSAADEQYAAAERDEIETRYILSEKLFYTAKAIFEEDADDTVMRDVEILSFFRDATDTLEGRESFVKFGKLVSAIQRDLAGTMTITHDQTSLYEEIRRLYAELLVEIDAGNYIAAENLAIEAYLENFEYLEPIIESVDPEFMYALELKMREDLRDMITGGDDPASIRTFLEETILTDLTAAEEMTAPLRQEPGSVSAFESTREMGDTTEQEQSAVRDEIDFIRDSLQEMLIQYQDGDYQSAYATARTAYLESYEHVEIPLRPIDPDFTLEVEYQFAQMRSLIKDEAPYDKVHEIVVEIRRSLDESERLVTGSGQIAPWIAFSASFAIIFREGLEAVLILGAIMTYLEASRNSRFKKYVHYGVIAAIAGTAVTWFVASYIIEISGAQRELIEAVAALSATAVLFYVSFWILNKIEHKKWMEFIKAKVWKATTTGSVMVFVMLSFFTVYREGFETVLFYQAMFSFAKYMETYVGLGFVLGMGSLLLLYYIMRKLGKRLPLRVLFGLTMGIGAYLSIAFLGNAIREFQMLDVIPYTSMMGTIPRLDINMATMTGIYPTLETVVGQIILLSVYLVASAYILVVRPRKEARMIQMRKSRRVEGDE